MNSDRLIYTNNKDKLTFEIVDNSNKTIFESNDFLETLHEFLCYYLTDMIDSESKINIIVRTINVNKKFKFITKNISINKTNIYFTKESHYDISDMVSRKYFLIKCDEYGKCDQLIINSICYVLDKICEKFASRETYSTTSEESSDTYKSLTQDEELFSSKSDKDTSDEDDKTSESSNEEQSEKKIEELDSDSDSDIQKRVETLFGKVLEKKEKIKCCTEELLKPEVVKSDKKIASEEIEKKLLNKLGEKFENPKYPIDFFTTSGEVINLNNAEKVKTPQPADLVNETDTLLCNENEKIKNDNELDATNKYVDIITKEIQNDSNDRTVINLTKELHNYDTLSDNEQMEMFKIINNFFYPFIFNKQFNTTEMKIEPMKSFDNIFTRTVSPIVYKLLFSIMLFIDGRDKEGKIVRKRTNNNLEKFNYLFKLMIKLEGFDKAHDELICGFINQLPLIDITESSLTLTKMWYYKIQFISRHNLRDDLLVNNQIFKNENEKREKELGLSKNNTDYADELEKQFLKEIIKRSDNKDVPKLDIKEEVKKSNEQTKIIQNNLEKIHNKDDNEKIEKNKKNFVNDKITTYTKIFNDLFMEKKIKNWNNIPPLFITKFIVLLFMDGKDRNGNQYRDRILDKDNEFEIFTMLHTFFESTIDDKIEFNETLDDSKTKLINEFTNFIGTVPIFDIHTQRQIMDALNSTNHPMFDTDIIDSGEIDDDESDLDCGNKFSFK
jgi:hypothetical protein